jgi:hypothetical protein
MKIIVAIALLIFTSIIACRKNNTANDFSSRIIGKWKFNSVIEWWTPIGGSVFGKDTFDVTNLGQQYREFRNDGKVYSLLSLFGSFYNDTTDYKINGNVIIMSENKTPILRDNRNYSNLRQ